MNVEDCEGLIQDTWLSHLCDGSFSSVSDGLEKCASKLKKWSKDKFGCIPKKVTSLQEELEALYSGELMGLNWKRIQELEL